MAIFHLHVKNIGRRDGRSAVAAAAYRAGETVWNEAEERESKFGGRRDVVFADIVLPDEAPAWMGERGRFWNALEARLKRKDARFAKEIEAALPRELPRAHWKAVALTFAKVYAARGIVVDVAIHDDGTSHNPHIHMLLSNQLVNPDGFGGANRSLIRPDFLKEARSVWAKIVNAALGNVGSSATIDARSYSERGIDRTPGEHRAPNLAARRARRREVYGREPSMNLDAELIEARKELLRESDVRARFPHLAAREDWPPADRLPPHTLTVAELTEYRAFWREVDTRAFEPKFDDRRPEYPEPTAGQMRGNRSAREEPAGREADEARRQELRQNYPEWEVLHRELVRRLEREGRDTSSPLHDPAFVRQALEKFEERLFEMQALREENARLRAQWDAFEREQERTMPVPDPAGEMLSQEQLDRKRAEVVEAMHQPADRVQTTLRPECAPAVEREEAAAAVLRQAAIDVPDREAVGPNRVQPHERDSSWLFERAAAREQGDRHPAPSTAEPQREEPAPREFAWLDSNPAEKAQERGSRNDLPEWLRADAARRPADREREEERDRQRER